MRYFIAEKANKTFSVERHAAGEPVADVASFIDRGRNGLRREIEKLVKEMNRIAG